MKTHAPGIPALVAFPAWRPEDFLGAAIVITMVTFLGVTLWFGWPAVNGWFTLR